MPKGHTGERKKGIKGKSTTAHGPFPDDGKKESIETAKPSVPVVKITIRINTKGKKKKKKIAICGLPFGRKARGENTRQTNHTKKLGSQKANRGGRKER